jgi:hypothetical protein
MKLQNYDGTSVPINKAGETYPSGYNIPVDISIDNQNAVSGNCCKVIHKGGALYLQFNPYSNSTRGFARDYKIDPSPWQFNTYNKMRIWIWVPVSRGGMTTNGTSNMEFGTYVKKVNNADQFSDETGGDHYYHMLNLPSLDNWVCLTFNMHPDHSRGTSGGIDAGYQPHPTGEPDYNYFDALTRFYFQDYITLSKYPVNWYIDEVEFYQENRQENDNQILTIASSYIPNNNRLVLTWNRHKDDNSIKHEVKYAFSDIHDMGWDKATSAPNGIITPLGWQGYNGMVYDTTQIPLADKDIVYIAIKPQNSNLFNQITLPLKKGTITPVSEKAIIKSTNMKLDVKTAGKYQVTITPSNSYVSIYDGSTKIATAKGQLKFDAQVKVYIVKAGDSLEPFNLKIESL